MAASGRNWSHVAISVAAFLSQHADHYGGDVVVAAVDVGLLNQRIDNPFGLGARHQQLLDASVVDHPRQSIAREQERIANSRLTVENVGLNLVRHADAAGYDVALGMPPGLLRRQK